MTFDDFKEIWNDARCSAEWARACEDQAKSMCEFMEVCGLYQEGIVWVNKLRARAKELRAEDGRNRTP